MTKMRTDVIGPFQGENRYLSNFFPAQTMYENVTYPTAEHAYQAAKTVDRNQRTLILACATPGQAKRAGKLVTLRPGWSNMDTNVMLEVVRDKFFRNAHLARRLLNTGHKWFVEYNTWHDNRWGFCTCDDCEGETHWNLLGHILIVVRAELLKGVK